MEIKSLITPIGAFNSFYVHSLLAKLVYINKRSSSCPPDLNLQKIVDKFFSNSELKHFPKYYLQGTPFQLSVWKALT